MPKLLRCPGNLLNALFAFPHNLFTEKAPSPGPSRGPAGRGRSPARKRWPPKQTRPPPPAAGDKSTAIAEAPVSMVLKVTGASLCCIYCISNHISICFKVIHVSIFSFFYPMIINLYLFRHGEMPLLVVLINYLIFFFYFI